MTQSNRGTFQITQLPNGSIEVKDINESTNGLVKEISDFKYERSEIPLDLIIECEKLNIETGETYFIFDNEISNHIKSRYLDKKEEKRDFNLSQLLSTEKYHIGTELYFREMPSRFSYYDTETKSSNRYLRYKIVVDFFKKMKFKPSEFNLGPEYEQSFIFEIKGTDENSDFYEKVTHKYVMRLKPNLFLSITLENFTEYLQLTPYIGFFNKGNIIKYIRENSPSNYESIIRDITIDQIRSMTTIENINRILSDKISDERKNELELFLINSSLDDKKKLELLEIVNNLLEEDLKIIQKL